MLFTPQPSRWFSTTAWFARVAGITLIYCLAATATRADNDIPHGQTAPPGPPLTPAEALARMKVPEGFSVDLVASEPDIVNPVSMTFDERGRIWITESVEYPRQEAGEGRDRVKILEDTDGDGRADRFTVFAEGLNIPSGVAVGGGGVWVANAPDILLLRDTDGDDKADKREVVVTGFGRTDTHELPNSLTWGPDGWLYGLNGVFNRSVVRQDDRVYRFTAAMFRIHPRTHKFELFAEGTSNPWGIAWDPEGSAFVSACVIDHLWHLVETGYYQRQAGAYPPFAWKIDSIVEHRHQQAAYCGLHYFDSDAYPPEYRGKLYMGNIHGNAINCDTLSRRGATYRGEGEPDFLSANDAWFLPLVQKTGPDGCLYILDWYDRYHCYQDARRDPDGIDRAKGRLYRVRYKDSPRAGDFDLTRESDDQLVARLSSPNVYFRDVAQRLLAERNNAETRGPLENLVLDETAPKPGRMHALWALIGAGPLDQEFHTRLLEHSDASLRAWGVRAAGNTGKVDDALRSKIAKMAADPAPDVRLQVAIAADKISGLDTLDTLLDVLTHSDDDETIWHIVWQNLHPRLDRQGKAFVAALAAGDTRTREGVRAIAPRAFERILAAKPANPAAAIALIRLYAATESVDVEITRSFLRTLADESADGELAGPQATRLREGCSEIFEDTLEGPSDAALYSDVSLLAASWGNQTARETARKLLIGTEQSIESRTQAAEALEAGKDPELFASIRQVFDSPEANDELRGKLLEVVSRRNDDAVADLALRAYHDAAPAARPPLVALLTSRPAWGRKLVAEVDSKQIDHRDVNVNHLHNLFVKADEPLRKDIERLWGNFRADRDPQRDKVIAATRKIMRRDKGDPVAGRVVFQKTCGTCHKIYGQGAEVGPDLTGNGRSSYDQLLSNIFDPSLVIGPAYQAQTVVTTDGRVLTGLVVEDNPQRIVLKMQGDKTETIPRDDVEQNEHSRLSLMPEGLEKQMTEQELIDLLNFLSLDRPPEEPEAKWLPGFDGNVVLREQER